MTERTTLFEGNHLRLSQRDGWEYVERPKVSGVVAMIAVTENRELVLIEQFRVPLNATVIELPAGLASDSGESEDLLSAAQRELMEETGFHADDLQIVGAGAPSAGLSTEVVTLVRSTSVRRVSPGAGVDGENIRVHLIPITDVRNWLEQQRQSGQVLDLKIYAALGYLEV
jgi:ADP-ribose pyrophosphatase